MPQDRWNVNESDNRLGYFEGTVIEDYFSDSMTESGGKANFPNADQTCKFWKVSVDDILQDYDGKAQDEVSIKLGLGKGWEKTPDGTAVRHDDDDPDNPDADKDFDVRSAYGQLIALCVGKRKEWKARRVEPLDGGGPVEYDFDGVRDYMRANDLDDPREAGVWTGTRWLFRGLGFQYNRDDDELIFSVRPVAFLGAGDNVKPSGSSGPGRVEIVEISADDVSSLLAQRDIGVTEELAGQIAKLVVTSSNFAAFGRNALALAGPSDEGLKTAIMDQAAGPWSLRG